MGFVLIDVGRAKDFKEFIRLAGLTHVKTLPYYRENRKMAPEPQGRLSQARLSALPAGWHSTDRAFR